MEFNIADKKPVKLYIGLIGQIAFSSPLKALDPITPPGAIAKISEKVISNRNTIPQILKLPLESGSAIHGAGRMFGIGGRFDFAKSQTVTLIVSADTDKIGAGKAGTILSFIAPIGPGPL